MNTENQNINLSLLLASLEDDFDKDERLRIFELLKNSNPTDDSLLGAKMILESNNWEYTFLKKALANTENRIEALATKTQKTSGQNYLKYAAVLIPIAFFLGYFFNNSLDNKESIEKFYTKEEGLPNYMGTEKTNWDALMKLYRANKMKEAYLVSEQILSQKPQNDTAIYFNAVISYELKNYKKAKTNYSKIVQNKQSIFYYDATFRLGFAIKNLHKNQTAKQQFETVANDPNNPYNENSKEVLEQLDK